MRLVKGAYWDTEIKRAQTLGIGDFPVFTAKLHTDLNYMRCAQLLRDCQDCIFPAFASHNAMTLAFVSELFAGADYELQRSEEHTSELQSLMSISYAVFCLIQKKKSH